MIKQIAHIGIAVKDLSASIDLFQKLLDSTVGHQEEVVSQKVRTAMIAAGLTTIELLEAMSPDSPVAKFLDKRGEGIHHIALEVDDIGAELTRLRSMGFVLIDEIPRMGADRCRVAFLHPKSTNGVLIELLEKVVDAEEEQ